MMSRETARSSIHAGGRRRFPRIQLDGVLEAFDTTMGVAVPINDVSYGGLQTLSPSPVLPLTEHHFRVTVRRGTVHKLRAHAVYCRPRADNQPPYIVGWRLGSDFETATSITALIDYLTTAASFNADALVPGQPATPTVVSATKPER